MKIGSQKLAGCLIALAMAVGAAATAQLGEKKTLTLDAVKQVAAAAEKYAANKKLKIVIAIADDGGNLLYLERMDEAPPGSVEVAIQKARSSALHGKPTKAFADAVAAGGIGMLKLPDVIPGEGGVPLMAEGKVIGAIGVSGASPQDDGEAAKAGVEVLVGMLKK